MSHWRNEINTHDKTLSRPIKHGPKSYVMLRAYENPIPTGSHRGLLRQPGLQEDGLREPFRVTEELIPILGVTRVSPRQESGRSVQFGSVENQEVDRPNAEWRDGWKGWKGGFGKLGSEC